MLLMILFSSLEQQFGADNVTHCFVALLCMKTVYTTNSSYLMTVKHAQIYHPKTQKAKQLIHILVIHNQ